MKITATIRVMSDIDALRTGVVLALERLCFASADSFSADVPEGATVAASVAFAGHCAGAVTIAMPSAMLLRFAEVLMPTDGEAPPILLDDVIGELANIVCGNVVPRIYGRDAVFALSLPTPERSSEPVVASTVVNFEDGWVAALLHAVPS